MIAFLVIGFKRKGAADLSKWGFWYRKQAHERKDIKLPEEGSSKAEKPENSER